MKGVDDMPRPAIMWNADAETHFQRVHEPASQLQVGSGIASVTDEMIHQLISRIPVQPALNNSRFIGQTEKSHDRA
jgi:hypothetical protein